MGPQCVDKFLHKIYRENLLKIKLVRKAATCMEASSGRFQLVEIMIPGGTVGPHKGLKI